jgi:hypothetical protein
MGRQAALRETATISSHTVRENAQISVHGVLFPRQLVKKSFMFSKLCLAPLKPSGVQIINRRSEG